MKFNLQNGQTRILSVAILIFSKAECQFLGILICIHKCLNAAKIQIVNVNGDCISFFNQFVGGRRDRGPRIQARPDLYTLGSY